MMEDKQHKNKVAQIFQKLLSQSTMFEDVKQTIKKLAQIAEKHTFHAITGNEEQYLQTYGLTYYQEEHFNFINHMLHQRTNAFLDKIAQSIVQVKSTIPPPPPLPPQIPSEIIQQVDQVLKNIDLPLSLFKRKDHYWSQSNPKTVQVKEYIKQLHDEDRKWKGELKKKRQEILNQKNQMYHKNNQQAVKQELKMKEQEKIKKLKKIEYLKSQPENRKRTIEQSIDFIKKQGRPLFKKMQEQFYNKVELPTLQQRKKKLSEVRQLRKSVDLVEIQQHRQKYQKIKEQHQPVKITDEAVKVSYKSEFYKNLSKSSIRYLSQNSRVKSLYDKRLQYGQIVKESFKPSVDQEKANEIAERIELMGRRYARAKKAFKNKKEQDDQDEQGEEEQQQPEPEPEPQEQEEQEQQDEDYVPKPKDDQYNPSNQERYKMGLKFLEEARKKRKKIQANKSQTIQNQDIKNKTFSVKDAIQGQKVESQHQTIGSDPYQSNRKIQYRNYLHEMSKTNKTIDFIDTSRIKKQFTQDMKLRKQTKQQEIESKLKTIQQRAKNEEELLKFKRGKKEEVLVRKQELDNAILDTIKARLALMKS